MMPWTCMLPFLANLCFLHKYGCRKVATEGNRVKIGEAAKGWIREDSWAAWAATAFAPRKTNGVMGIQSNCKYNAIKLRDMDIWDQSNVLLLFPDNIVFEQKQFLIVKSYSYLPCSFLIDLL